MWLILVYNIFYCTSKAACCYENTYDMNRDTVAAGLRKLHVCCSLELVHLFTIGIRGCRYLGKSRLAWISRSCAEQIYWRNARGHCVIMHFNVSCVDEPACNQ
mgnify:CR=1 FL=1